MSVAAPPRRLRDLAGIGPELERKLGEIDIRTPADLAATYPRDYKDWRTPTPIAEIVRGALERAHAGGGETTEEITVATVAAVRELRARIPIVVADLTDGSGRLTATWFGRRGVTRGLAAGDRVFVHGRVALKRVRGSVSIELNVLHHRKLRDGEDYVGDIVPIYPAGKEVSSRLIAGAIARNVDVLAGFVRDAVPDDLMARRGLPPVRAAWRALHHPATLEAASQARTAMIYAEFLGLALSAAVRRADRERTTDAPVIPAADGLLDEFAGSLPFALTGAQQRVIREIYADLGRRSPMNRLVQGDVGSGKTLVAAAAIVRAARAGVQSALMAPTEILAAQHAAKLVPLLLPFGVRTEALFGSLGSRSRERVLTLAAGGDCDLVVGTHALLTEDVAFANLGLVVIDEQHRFGVAQRAKLRGKAQAPHTLYMTATPIPRTLAQTRYADLDLSIIDELPPGRRPVETYVLRESRKHLAYAFVRKNVARGRQAYIVAAAIDESESALTGALAELEILRRDVFADLRVGLLHGRLATREKDVTMAQFSRGEIDVLMATTVVEVGVDVANASVMVILDAHRYGLAQLHQLRGRVGRGAARSFCVLITPDDRPAVERLNVLERTNDGFVIAEEDLRLRREGEVAGTAQSGSAALLGSIVDDFALYMSAKADADAIVAGDPQLRERAHSGLRALLDEPTTQREMRVSS